MNHYPHHIGDFDSATRHLTVVERAFYRDLLDIYYDTEKPILEADFDKIARKILARSKDEKESLRLVLLEFFTLKDGAFHNARCDEEIETYREKQRQASISGKKSASARAMRKFNGGSTAVQPPSSDRQLTINHKPITNTPLPPQAGDGREVVGMGGGDEEKALEAEKNHFAADAEEFEIFWNAYPEHRRTKKVTTQRDWCACKFRRPSLAVILAALESHVGSADWQREEGKFIPSAVNWLSEQMWYEKKTPGKKIKTVVAKPEVPIPDIDDSDALAWLRENYEIIENIPTSQYSKPFKQWLGMAQEAYLNYLKSIR